MKWLDKIIDNKIENKLFINASQINDLQQHLNDEIIKIKSIREELSYLKKDILDLREDFSSSKRMINLKIHEREQELRMDMELSISGMTKVVDKRLESLGEKKSIVVDLLKKIAKLESGNVP